MMARIFRGVGAPVIAVVQALIVGAMLALPVTASQAPLSNPTSGTLSGLTMVLNYNAAIDAVASCNSAGAAPTTQFLSGAPSLGNCWLNTNNNSINFYDGTSNNWVTVGYIDPANHLFIPLVGGGVASSVASAATTNLCSSGGTTVRGSNIAITGTTAITSFGSFCVPGQIKFLTFGGALTLTYNAASMILPTGASITTATGDTALAIYLGSGNWQILFYQPATGAALSTVGLNVGAGALGASALGFNMPVNLGLTASIASNALTVSIVAANGAAPTATNPVLIPFRSTTLATATPVIDSVQGTVSMTVGSGFTMGCSSGSACRIWIYAIDNGSNNVLLGLQTCASATQIFSCSDDLLYNTNANTNGTNLNGVLAANIAGLTGKAVRIIGYLEATETTAGTWATAPSKIQVFGPGVKKPGDVVQTVFVQNGTGASTGGTFASSNVTGTITPTSAVNLIAIDASVTINTGAAAVVTAAVRRGTSLNVSQSEQIGGTGTGANDFGIDGVLAFSVLDAPATTSSTSYAIYFNSSTGSSSVVNGHIKVQEIMGALEEPANDAGVPPRLVG
jgi:hypothetical protein